MTNRQITLGAVIIIAVSTAAIYFAEPPQTEEDLRQERYQERYQRAYDSWEQTHRWQQEAIEENEWRAKWEREAREDAGPKPFR